jgi:D-lactate dehydrogenase (cytochrome)
VRAIFAVADCIAAAQADSAEHGLTALVGHVGEGNFHTCALVEPNDAEDGARAQAFHARLAERALARGRLRKSALPPRWSMSSPRSRDGG